MFEVNFERDRFEGQMNPEERKLLYDTVLKFKPMIIVETGTCRGGGSTYFIASALANLREIDGVHRAFHTIEMHREFYDYAVALYSNQLDYLRPYVSFFHFGNSLSVLRAMSFQMPKVDLLMLDGGADSMASLYEFTLVRPIMPIGSHVVMHDWGNSKCTYMRPVITNDHDWRMIDQAIDLVVFERIGDFHQCS